MKFNCNRCGTEMVFVGSKKYSQLPNGQIEIPEFVCAKCYPNNKKLEGKK